jgi:hypothetical protein
LKQTRFPFGRTVARRRRQKGGVPMGHGRSKTCVIRQIWRPFFRPSAATVASGRKRDRNQPIVSKFTKERHGCCHTTTRRAISGRDHHVVGLRRDIVLGINSHTTKGTERSPLQRLAKPLPTMWTELLPTQALGVPSGLLYQDAAHSVDSSFSYGPLPQLRATSDGFNYQE